MRMTTSAHCRRIDLIPIGGAAKLPPIGKARKFFDTSSREGYDQILDFETTLQTEVSRLAHLTHLQQDLRVRIRVVERRIDALRILVADHGSDDSDLDLDLVDVFTVERSIVSSPRARALDRTPRPDPTAERRFGSAPTAFAKDLIVRHGPQTVEHLIETMPSALREDIAANGHTQTLDYRVRRVFRRSSDFDVDRRSGRVMYVGGLEEGLVPIISRLIVGPDAMEAVVMESNGIETSVPIERFSNDVRAGRLFGVRGPNRISSVAFSNGFYRSMHGGEPNEDMRNVPRERRG